MDREYTYHKLDGEDDRANLARVIVLGFGGTAEKARSWIDANAGGFRLLRHGSAVAGRRGSGGSVDCCSVIGDDGSTMTLGLTRRIQA